MCSFAFACSSFFFSSVLSFSLLMPPWVLSFTFLSAFSSPAFIFPLLSVPHPPLTPTLLLISPSVSPGAYLYLFSLPLPDSLVRQLDISLVKSWSLLKLGRRGRPVVFKSLSVELSHRVSIGGIFAWLSSTLCMLLVFFTLPASLSHTHTFNTHNQPTPRASQPVSQSVLGAVLFQFPVS